MNNNQTKYRAPRNRLPSPAQVLAHHRKSVMSGGREPSFNAGDEVRQVYAAVQQESVAITEDQARAYGRALYTYQERVVEEHARVAKIARKEQNEGMHWSRVTKFSYDFLPPAELQEYRDLQEVLVRAVMPIIGITSFDYAGRFGSVGAAFSAAYRESMNGVLNYDPGIGKRGLTAFIKSRLAKRMQAHLMEEEGNRAHAETAALMEKFLKAMDREVYASHDPREIYAELVELHGGWIDEACTVPCDEFLQQSLNTLDRVIKALAAVEFSHPLSLDYSVDAAKDTLADTISDFGADPELIERQQMLEDLSNNVVWLEQLGYTAEFQDQTRDVLNELLSAAWESSDVAAVIFEMAHRYGLDASYVKDLLVVWGPFYQKYLPEPEETAPHPSATINTSTTSNAA